MSTCEGVAQADGKITKLYGPIFAHVMGCCLPLAGLVIRCLLCFTVLELRVISGVIRLIRLICCARYGCTVCTQLTDALLMSRFFFVRNYYSKSLVR